MGRRLSEKEREARRNLREARDLLKGQIEAYENLDEFSIKDAIAAIRHAYSIVARYELEYEAIPPDSYFLNLLEEIEDSSYEDKEDKTVTIDKKVFDKMTTALEREKSRTTRASLLKDMTKANRVLAQQVSENEKISELQKRSKYIEVATHRQVLEAYVKLVILALRQLGYADADIAEFARQLKHLERNYPLVQMNKEKIIQEISPEEDPLVIEAESKIVHRRQTPQDLERKAEELL